MSEHTHEGGSIEGGFIYCSHEGCNARAPINDDEAAVWIWTEEPVALEFKDDRAEAVGDDPAEAAGEESQTGAEGAEGSQDAPGMAETVIVCECGHTLEQHDRDTPLGPVCGACKCAGWNPVEEIVQTAPVFEAELVISSCGVFVQRLPGGGRQLKVVPIRQTPQGPQIVLPAYVLEFATPEAWDTFKGAIENDGKPRTKIVTATHLPPGATI